MRRYTIEVDGTPFTIDVEETAADRFVVRVGDRVLGATLRSDEDLPGSVIVPGMPPATESGPAAGSGPAAMPAAPTTAVSAAPTAAPTTAMPAALASLSRPTGSPPADPGAAPVGPLRTHAGTPGVAGDGRSDALTAPMPGVVLEVHVRVGAVLRRGDPVLVLEAMKMRNTIRAPYAGVIVAVEVEAGQPVGPGDVLVRLGPTA